MKKVVIVLIIILLIGCTKEKEENNIIEMKIKYDTLTNENVTVIIENNTENDIEIKPNFDIEQNNNMYGLN